MENDNIIGLPVKPPPPNNSGRKIGLSNPRKKQLAKSTENFFSPKKNESHEFFSDDSESDLDYRFELNEPPLQDEGTSTENSQNSSFESSNPLLNLRREYASLLETIKQQKIKFSSQNQTKLNADIKYLRDSIYYMNTSINHLASQASLNQGIIDQMKQPQDYSIKCNEISKHEVKLFTLSYEQIDLLRNAISFSTDKSFADNVNTVLSEKEEELQKLQGMKEDLMAEITDLKEKFIAQSEFINKQKFKQETAKFNDIILKNYRENLQNIRDFSDLGLLDLKDDPPARRNPQTIKKNPLKPIISFPKVGGPAKMRTASLQPMGRLNSLNTDRTVFGEPSDDDI